MGNTSTIPVYCVNTNKQHWALYFAGFLFELFENNGKTKLSVTPLENHYYRMTKVVMLGKSDVTLFSVYSYAEKFCSDYPNYKILLNDCQCFCMGVASHMGVSSSRILTSVMFSSLNEDDWINSVKSYKDKHDDFSRFRRFVIQLNSEKQPTQLNLLPTQHNPIPTQHKLLETASPGLCYVVKCQNKICKDIIISRGMGKFNILKEYWDYNCTSCGQQMTVAQVFLKSCNWCSETWDDTGKKQTHNSSTSSYVVFVIDKLAHAKITTSPIND